MLVWTYVKIKRKQKKKKIHFFSSFLAPLQKEIMAIELEDLTLKIMIHEQVNNIS
jgi:hypothetical protein